MTQFDDQTAAEYPDRDDIGTDSSDAFIADPQAAAEATRERMNAQAEAEREAGHPISSDPNEDLTGAGHAPLAGDPAAPPDSSPGSVPPPAAPAPVPDVAPVPGVQPDQPLPGREPADPGNPLPGPTDPGNLLPGPTDPGPVDPGSAMPDPAGDLNSPGDLPPGSNRGLSAH